MQSLTNLQKQSLVKIITEEFGGDLLLEEFSEVLLSMLEDVAGFESCSEEEISSTTQQLWSIYYG